MISGSQYKESRYNIWVDRQDFHYVYNGLSGGVLAVPKTDYLALRRCLNGNGDLGTEIRPSLLQDLLLGRILVSASCDEQSVLAAKYKAGRQATDHLSLVVVTSLGCNFDCPYCFEDKHASIMDADCQHALVKLLDDKLSSIKSFSVEWFGGEPLIGKTALLTLSDLFIEHCDRAGVSYSASIVTNGSLLDKKTCVELRERRVVSAQVGLDGPPEIHDRMRPAAGGRGSFWRIIRNLHTAVDYFRIGIRVNVDQHNLQYAEALLKILKDEGFCGKLHVGLGQLLGIADGAPAPSATYGHRCLSNREFALAQERFARLTEEYGFSRRNLPRPINIPCIAASANGLVIGSNGEIYKCYISVGNPAEVIGNIRHYEEPNGRLQKWLKFNPFDNDECRECIALPVCMGGCAHHAMDLNLYENRCSSFRHTYLAQVQAVVEKTEEDRDDHSTG
jgi:uncharacterized protein